MNYVVNDACIGCGLCASICPDVFHLENGLAVAVPGAVLAENEPSANEAMASCPVSAIEME